MTDVEQKVFRSPQATANEESATVQSKEFLRNKWVVVAVCIAFLFAVDALMFVAMDLTLLRARRPDYGLQSVTIEKLRVSNGTAPPSFDMQLSAQVKLRNGNFGSYKFLDGYLTFSYRGTPVGEAVISESSVTLRSTKMMGVLLNVTSKAASRNTSLGSDIEAGLVRMTVDSNLRGQVRFLKVYPKEKSAKMHCGLTVNLAKKVAQDLRCN